MKSNLLALAVGVFVFLVAGELALRALAHFSPTIRFVATAGMKFAAPQFASLEDFVAAKPNQLRPHQEWFNYFNNQFGFNDEEFAELPAPGVRRVLALGDSFLFGLAPHPLAVGRQLEQELSNSCNQPVEILNAGVPASGVWDYRQLAELMLKRFHPQTVVVHFYLGNDGPDLLSGRSDVPAARAPFFQSYLTRTFKNSLKLLRGVQFSSPDRSMLKEQTSNIVPHGGQQVALGRDLDPSDRALTGPTFSDAEFDAVLADEITRFAVVSPSAEDSAWTPVLTQLAGIRDQAMAQNARLIFVFYPSQLQLDSALLQRAVMACNRLKKSCHGLSPKDFEPQRPADYLTAAMAGWGVPIADMTTEFSRSLTAVAGSAEPAAVYMLNDTHWNVRGNRLAAQFEAKALAPAICAN